MRILFDSFHYKREIIHHHLGSRVNINLRTFGFSPNSFISAQKSIKDWFKKFWISDICEWMCQNFLPLFSIIKKNVEVISSCKRSVHSDLSHLLNFFDLRLESKECLSLEFWSKCVKILSLVVFDGNIVIVRNLKILIFVNENSEIFSLYWGSAMEPCGYGGIYLIAILITSEYFVV